MYSRPSHTPLKNGAKRTVFCPRYTRNGGVELTYSFRELGTERQKRLQGRLLAEPASSLDAYLTRAVLDWVSIDVQFNEMHHYKYLKVILQETLESTFVYARSQDEKRAYKGKRFTIYVNDVTPKMLQTLQNALYSIENDTIDLYPIAMEVAVDFYAKDSKDITRQQMVALLQRHFLPTRAPWADDYWGLPRTTVHQRKYARAVDAGTVETTSTGKPKPPSVTYNLSKPERLQRRPFVDGTLYYGSSNAPVMWRIYDKVRDGSKDRKFNVLGQTERRARIEVQLQSSALARLEIKTLSDLARFRFENLAQSYFSFWQATLPPTNPRKATLVSLASVWFQEAYWTTFAETGVFGVLRSDQQTLAHLAAVNRQMPTAYKRRGPDGRTKPYQIGSRITATDEKGNRWRVGQQGYLVNYEALSERVRHALADLSSDPS